MLTFEEIVRKPQHVLKKALMSELTRMGYRTRTKKGFLYAKGNVPVLLVAHLDTVHKEAVKDICYSADGNIVMSPQGIGGDDRAGVYMILQIIQRYRCHVLFCEDEEVGGVGASAFAASDIRPSVNYIIELDRRGSDDAVFYDCDNPEFTEFVTDHRFIEDYGSFSDISIIAPALGIAAVNLSAGYFHEHTRHEYVDMAVINRNIQRVCQMVSTPTQKFEYIESMFGGWRLRGGRYYEDALDFNRYYGNRGKDVAIKPLMMLPGSAHVKMPNGDMVECDEQFYIDEAGMVYEYLYDVDVAVEVPDCEARTENGLPVKYKDEAAINIEVVPVEFVLGEYA